MKPSTKLTAKSRDAKPRDGRSREARLAALIRLGKFATGKSSATSA